MSTNKLMRIQKYYKGSEYIRNSKEIELAIGE